MADDVNKSKMGGQNTFGMSDIEKIGQGAYSIPKSEQEQRMRASTARQQLNLLQDLPDDVVNGSRVLSRISQNAPNTLRSAEGRIRSSVESRLERSNAQAMNAVSREYSESSVNGIVRGMYNNTDFQNRAMTMMNGSFEDLASKRAALSGNIQSLGAQSAGLAGNIFTARGMRGDIQNQIAGNASSAHGMTQEMASIDLAMKSMRSSGRDPLSRFESLNASGKSASGMLGAASLGEEMRGGGVNISRGGSSQTIKNGDIGSALLTEANNLAAKLKELSEATGKSTEELDKLRKEAEESAGNFEKLKTASGGMGGGISGSQWASAAGGMFNAAGGAIQQIAVGQRLGQVANVSGYAGIENQKYDTYKAGRGGDIMSQMLLGQYGDAQRFGGQLKTGQQAAVGAFTAGSAAQTVAGGFQMAEGATDKVVGIGGHLMGTGGISTQETLAGVLNGLQGLAGTATNGMDLIRGVSTNAAGIQGTQAQMEARRAVMKVQAEQMQGFRDFGVGMGVAAQGLGGKGEAFLQNSMSDKGMQNMVDARMSPEQMAQMAGMGISTMGGQFQSSQVLAARGMERSGFGSMGANMQNMASLSAAGSNNPQAGLASVLEVAVTRGLDSSKSIQMMAEGTASLVSTSSGRAAGMDTTNASATFMGSLINPNDSNREFATQRAATLAGQVNQVATSTDANFSGMVATARISKSTGLDSVSAIAAQKLDVQTLKSLQGMDADKQREMLLQKGVNVSGMTGSKVTNVIGTLAEDAQMKLAEAGGIGIAVDAGRGGLKTLVKKSNSGAAFTDQEKVEAGQISALAGFGGSADDFKRMIGSVASKNDPNASGKVDKIMKGEAGGDTMKTLDDLRTSGFKQLSEAAMQATKTLGGAASALKTIAQMNNEFEKIGATGGEGKFSTAGADAAGTFGKSTQQFETAVIKFSAIMDKAGLGEDKFARDANRMMNKIKDPAMLNAKSGRGNGN